MNSLRMRWQNFLLLAKAFRFREIIQKLVHRAYYDNYSYCLRRDLEIPFPAPEAQIPIIVRPLAEDDISKLFAGVSGLPVSDQADLYARMAHWNANIPTCYVGVTGDGAPTYIQWLMGREQNGKIQAFFNGTFPVLAPEEALLENALTLAQFRGKGIMPAAMARIAEQGKTLGARYVLTFVEQHNIPSLKGCKKSGFLPYMIRHERWVLFRRSLTFTRLPEGTPYPFDAEDAMPERT
jgi:GNAT superfamily N-acetyltransferase